MAAVAAVSLALGVALGVVALVPGLAPMVQASPGAGGGSGSRGLLGPLTTPPLDLDTLDWAEATIPGSVCGASAPITLHQRQALSVASSLDPEYPQDVAVDPSKVVDGDVTGDGRDEAAVPVTCANHDSTLAGLQVQTVMLLDGSSGRLELLGTLASSQPKLGEIPNAVAATRLAPGSVQGQEQFYGPTDANCCPSGSATTVWPWADDHLGPPRATVTNQAAGVAPTPPPIAVSPAAPTAPSPAPAAGALAGPVPLSPPDGAVFDFYPRTTPVSWSAVAGAATYTVEVQYLDGGNDEWLPEPSDATNPGLTTTSFTFSFVGAQPGRWRVTAVGPDGGAGTPSPWSTFVYRR